MQGCKQEVDMKKQTVDLLNSNDETILMMRGRQTKEQVIDTAIKENIICESDKSEWVNCDRVYVCYYKAVPRDGYSAYYYPSNKDVKGAFLATALIIF